MENSQYQKDEAVVMPPEPDHGWVLEAVNSAGDTEVSWRDHDGLRWIPQAGRRTRRPEDWANIVEYCMRYGMKLIVRQREIDGAEFGRQFVLDIEEPSKEWVINHNSGVVHFVTRIVVLDGEPVLGPPMEEGEDGLRIGPFIRNESVDQTVILWRRHPHTGKVVVVW